MQTYSTKELSFGNFIRFVFRETQNRLLLLITVVGTIAQFVVFKYFYPFPDFSTDSYSYIHAASQHLTINIWPIGYSRFLALFHQFTHSAFALIAFQYFFLVLSEVYFFFSMHYFYRFKRSIRNILFIFLFFNPLPVYLSNYIGSDTIFLTLSLLWFTELLWIINKPGIVHVFAQAILIFFCFAVRNNAYYYPIIASLAFILTRQKLRFKLAGIVSTVILILPFVIYTRNEAFKLTGTRQFSLFTGWQLANNALYIYEKIDVDSNIFKSEACRELERMNIRFFKHSDSWGRHRNELSANEGNFFIQYINSPLKAFKRVHYPADLSERSHIATWGKASAVFEEYGTTVIKHHPFAFARYYMLLNAKNYFLPPLEKLAIYNRAMDSMEIEAQDWFDYKTPNLEVVSVDLQQKIFFIYPTLFLLINLYFLACLAWFITRKIYREPSLVINSTIILASALLFINFGFSVFATINVFRYQVFPMVICTGYLLLLAERIYAKESSKERTITTKVNPGLMHKPFKFLR